MSTLTERLTTAVVLTETEATKLSAIVEGPATGAGSVVTTVNGPVKTAAAKILEIEERADDIYVARDEAEAAAEQAALNAALANRIVAGYARVAAVGNSAISGLLTIDGLTLVAGDIVLLTAQSTAHQNGPWVAASGSWTRPAWYAAGNTTHAAFGAGVAVNGAGISTGGSVWRLTSPTSGTITIGTTSTTWTRGVQSAPTAATTDSSTLQATTAMVQAVNNASGARTSLGTLSTAGNTDLPAATAQNRRRYFEVTIGAGAFTRTLSALTASAQAGDELELSVTMPASATAIVELRNATSGGTPIGTLPTDAAVSRVWSVWSRYTGTAWGAATITPLNARDYVAGKLNPIAASRAPVDYALIDGVTTNCAIISTLGTAGSVVNSQATIGPIFFRVPSAPVAAGIWGIQSGTTARSLNYANAIGASLGSTGALIVRATGAVDTSDWRSLDWASFQSTYAGKVVGLVCVLSASAPVVFLHTPELGWVNVSTNFADTAFGTAPAWMNPNLVPTYFVQGWHLNGEFRPGRLINRAWAQADMDYLALYGRVPPQDEFAGNAVAMNSANWGGNQYGGTSYTVTGASATGFTAVAVATSYFQTWMNSGSGVATVPLRSSRSVRVRGDAVVNSGQIDIALRTAGSYGSNIAFVSVTGSFDVVLSMTGGGPVPPTYNVAIGGGGSADFSVSNLVVTAIGTVAAPELGWTAQARGKFNSIHAALAPGVTPMPVHDADVQVIDYEMAATGYLLGTTGPHVFRTHKIDKVEAYPTTATPPTITLRRNATSGGTPIVNAVSSGTQNQWSSLTITAGTENGEAGDYYHVTLGSSNNVRLRIYLSAR